MKPLFVNARIVTDATDYHAAQKSERGSKEYVMSHSSLMAFADNPARWEAGYSRKDTKSSIWGRLVDCLFLTPDDFPSKYLVTPATYKKTMMQCPQCGSMAESQTCRTNGCKSVVRIPKLVEKEWNNTAEECKPAIAQAAKERKEVISDALYCEAMNALRVLKSDPQINLLRNVSKTQVKIVAQYYDEATNITIDYQALLDMMPEGGGEFCVADFADVDAELKTGVSAFGRPWQRAMFQNNYDSQAAGYLLLHNATIEGPNKRTGFVWVVQENFPPYAVGRKEASIKFLELGEMKLRNALRRYCDCLASGVWPGPDDQQPKEMQPRSGWTLVEPEAWMIDQVAQGIPTLQEPEPLDGESPEDEILNLS